MNVAPLWDALSPILWSCMKGVCDELLWSAWWIWSLITQPRQKWDLGDSAVHTPCEWAAWWLPVAASCRCGDELVEINDFPVHCMTLNEVYAILSHCNPGPIPIMVSRHPDPQVTPPGHPLPPRPTLAGFPWEQEVTEHVDIVNWVWTKCL